MQPNSYPGLFTGRPGWIILLKLSALWGLISWGLRTTPALDWHASVPRVRPWGEDKHPSGAVLYNQVRLNCLRSLDVTDGETEAQRGWELVQGHTAC